MEEKLLFALIIFGLLGIPGIFFLMSMQNALERCSPECRAMSPSKVWLTLIPFFNFIWQFIVVARVASSLRNEFLRRQIPLPEAEPRQTHHAMRPLVAVLDSGDFLDSSGALSCMLDPVLDQDYQLLTATRRTAHNFRHGLASLGARRLIDRHTPSSSAVAAVLSNFVEWRDHRGNTILAAREPFRRGRKAPSPSVYASI